MEMNRKRNKKISKLSFSNTNILNSNFQWRENNGFVKKLIDG